MFCCSGSFRQFLHRHFKIACAKGKKLLSKGGMWLVVGAPPYLSLTGDLGHVFTQVRIRLMDNLPGDIIYPPSLLPEGILEGRGAGVYFEPPRSRNFIPPPPFRHPPPPRWVSEGVGGGGPPKRLGNRPKQRRSLGVLLEN